MAKGQSLVELAIGFTLLMLLLSGAFEFGVAFFQFVQLRDSAQEGALYGSYCQDIALIEARVKGASSSPVDLNSPDVTIEIKFTNQAQQTIAKANVKEGDGVYVRVSYKHKVWMPFLPAIIGDYIYLHGDVTDTILRVAC